MAIFKTKALASAVIFSLLLTGCGSDSDDNSSDNSSNLNQPPEGVTVTADSTFKIYSLAYSISGSTDDDDSVTQTLVDVVDGNLVSSTDTIIVDGDGSFEDDSDDDDVTVLGNQFQYLLDDNDSLIGDAFYGLTTDYFSIKDNISNKSLVYRLNYEPVVLSGIPYNATDNETPLSIFTNPNNLVFPAGSVCYAAVGSSWSENIYLTNFDDDSAFTSVEEWRNFGFNTFYDDSVSSDMVGTTNQYAAYRLTDSDNSPIYPGLVESNGKFYGSSYLPKNTVNPRSGECERYNEVAVNFITGLLKQYYNR